MTKFHISQRILTLTFHTQWKTTPATTKECKSHVHLQLPVKETRKQFSSQQYLGYCFHNQRDATNLAPKQITPSLLPLDCQIHTETTVLLHKYINILRSWSTDTKFDLTIEHIIKNRINDTINGQHNDTPTRSLPTYWGLRKISTTIDTRGYRPTVQKCYERP